MADMRTIGNFPDLASAQVAQSLLQAEGITATIPDEFLAGIDWQMSTALQGVRLQVAPEDADDAEALLATLTPTDAEPASDVCPSCGSAAIGPAPWRRRLKGLFMLFPPLVVLAPLLLFGRHTLVCSACGRSWRAR